MRRRAGRRRTLRGGGGPGGRRGGLRARARHGRPGRDPWRAALSRPGCAFCDIVAGREPAHVAYADELALGFLDRRPLFPGHVLLVPREHHETLADLPPQLLAPLFGAAQRLAVAVESAMDARGTFVAINNRVSQSVPHLHVHVVPRRPKDGLRGFFWPRTRYEDEAEMAGVAARIATYVGAP